MGRVTFTFSQVMLLLLVTRNAVQCVKVFHNQVTSKQPNSQAMRTYARRLFVVPAELQATHWHQ